MSDYHAVLYTHPLSSDCLRVRRVLKDLGVEVETRNVWVSRKNRGELERLLNGEVRVPCLVLPGTVIPDRDAILRFLHLRYGNENDNDRHAGRAI